MPEAIHGLVLDQDGLPIEQARACFVSGPVPLADVAALTDANGTFQLTAPVPGTYSILCALEDGRSETRSVDVTSHSKATVIFEMTAGTERL